MNNEGKNVQHKKPRDYLFITYLSVLHQVYIDFFFWTDQLSDSEFYFQRDSPAREKDADNDKGNRMHDGWRAGSQK